MLIQYDIGIDKIKYLGKIENDYKADPEIMNKIKDCDDVDNIVVGDED